MARKELLLACATAALSFVGAILGVYLSSHFDQANWNQRFALKQKQTIIDKRVSLIEKTISLLNDEPIVKGLRGTLDMDEQLALIAVRCSQTKKAPRKNCNPPPSINTSNDLDSAKQMYELNAQLTATLSLDSIFFGPETKKAVQDLKNDGRDGLWSSPQAKKQALVDAMGRELDWFPR